MLRLGKRNHSGRSQGNFAAAGRNIFSLLMVCGGLLLAGCSVNGPTSSSLSPRGGTTVAFESIDGLPRGQFQKLVKALTDEAETRQIAVVTRESSATFRARGYAAAHLRGKETVITWVWDVYDADKQRAVRISGEEKGAGGQRGWSAADEATLKRIAGDSIAQLSVFLTNPGQPAPIQQKPSDGVAIAENASETGSETTVTRSANAGRRAQTAVGPTIAAYSSISHR
jgi:hypothetical protein